VEVLGEKPVPLPLYPSHVLHGLTQDQTWASIVRGLNQPPEPWNRLSEAQQMLLDNYLNTQFVPHRKHNNLYYKDHPFNVAYKTNPLNAELKSLWPFVLVIGNHIIPHVSRVWANCCLLSVI